MKALIGCLMGTLVALPSLGAVESVKATDVFVLSSPAFEDNGRLARRYAGNDKSSANCVGENVSPPLTWSNPPQGTRSYALILFDPEGRGGLGVVHWVAYGIPVSVTGFAEGEVSKPSPKYVGGRNSRDVASYSGPCTPPGDWHHYTFTLIATDLEPKALQPAMTRDELFAQLNGHARGAAGLIGRFRHE